MLKSHVSYETVAPTVVLVGLPATGDRTLDDLINGSRTWMLCQVFLELEPVIALLANKRSAVGLEVFSRPVSVLEIVRRGFGVTYLSCHGCSKIWAHMEQTLLPVGMACSE